MRYPFPRQCAAVLLFLVLPLAVLCCEDECQRGVTNAYVGNYTSILHAAMLTIVGRSSPNYAPSLTICVHRIKEYH